MFSYSLHMTGPVSLVSLHFKSVLRRSVVTKPNLSSHFYRIASLFCVCNKFAAVIARLFEEESGIKLNSIFGQDGVGVH